MLRLYSQKINVDYYSSTKADGLCGYRIAYQIFKKKSLNLKNEKCDLDKWKSFDFNLQENKCDFINFLQNHRNNNSNIRNHKEIGQVIEKVKNDQKIDRNLWFKDDLFRYFIAREIDYAYYKPYESSNFPKETDFEYFYSNKTEIKEDDGKDWLILAATNINNKNNDNNNKNNKTYNDNSIKKTYDNNKRKKNSKKKINDKNNNNNDDNNTNNISNNNDNNTSCHDNAVEISGLTYENAIKVLQCTNNICFNNDHYHWAGDFDVNIKNTFNDSFEFIIEHLMFNDKFKKLGASSREKQSK